MIFSADDDDSDNIERQYFLDIEEDVSQRPRSFPVPLKSENIR